MLSQKKAEQFRGLLNKWLVDLNQDVTQSAVNLEQEEETLADWTDIATIETDKAMQHRIRDRELALIAQVKEALRRLDEQTFGECERCGEFISESRLKASPITTLCIDCKTEIEGTSHRYR